MLRGFEFKVRRARDGREFVSRLLSAHRGAPVAAVGVQGSAASAPHGEGSPLTTAEVAAVNEFGMGVPERPFMRATFEQRASDVAKLGAALERKVLQGALSVEQALAVIGQAAVSMVRATIDSGLPPPNAPSTVERKGSSGTLRDTGQLKGHITAQVRRGA